MKKTLTLLLCSLFVVSAFAQKKETRNNTPLVLKNKIDSLSYAFGANTVVGMDMHLKNIGVIKDTALVSFFDLKEHKLEDYDANASLKKEAVTKQKEVIAANAKAMNDFQKGVAESFLTKGDENAAYNAGVGIGGQLKSMARSFDEQVLKNLDGAINKEAFMAAMISNIEGKVGTIEDAQGYFEREMAEIQQADQIKQAEELQMKHGERISEEVRFMADNRNKEDVVALASGIQYKVLTEGSGNMPSASDRVVVHYEGRLLDGTVVDSSYRRGETITFGVGQVIKGWTEVLQLMPVGSKWKVYIPYNLAYGEAGSGSMIPPFSTLEFDIELIEIEQ